VAAKLKKGDKVIVISGRDRKKSGEIVKVLPDPIKGDRVIIRGINVQSKTMRPNLSAGQQGGIVKREASIHASNIALADPVTGQRTRVGFKFIERLDESTGLMRRIKVRYSKRSGAEID
jgi:large subunit ribosomal protein L24